MKKLLATLITFQIILMIFAVNVFAAAPTASVTGPSTVRAGDTITITVKMNGTGLSAVQGAIKYDSAQLTYKSNAGALAGWAIDIDGSTAGTVSFLGIDDKLAAPINNTKQLFTLSFQVKANVATGANIKVTTANLSASDGNSDFTPANTTYSVTVVAPLSTNTFLSSMTVSNASVSPVFNKNTISYLATVPFSVSKLEIIAKAEDSKSKVEISGQNLSVGSNIVNVVVTAENGSKKTYSINVKREQNPDYEASNNANLKSITPNIGILSPVFDSAKTLYNVYLPYEITEFNATGVAADSKATGVEKEKIELNVGENKFIITGVAENGSKKDYTIMVIRMPAQGETVPDPTATIAPTEGVNPDSTATTVPTGNHDMFTLSGTLLDANNNPLVNKIIEIHSEIKKTTTDDKGCYKFENVTLGEHTIYIKDTDSSELANMPITINKGDKTLYKDGILNIEGDVRLDLALKDSSLEVMSAKKATHDNNVKSIVSGTPWWGTLLIVIAAVILGFSISQIINKRKHNTNR